MNEILSIITLIISFVLIILCYKYLGKTGLYIWIAVACITANIQSVKIIDIFGFCTSLGNIMYGTTFLATDILNLKYGEKAARKTIIYGFVSIILMTLFMSLCLLYRPSSSDISQSSLKLIFTLNFRITIASLAGFAVSQFVDARLFNTLQKKYNKLWISNNVSTMISQLFDTIIFVTISYIGTISFNFLLEIGISMYIFKFVIALCDTPFIYLSRKITNK